MSINNTNGKRQRKETQQPSSSLPAGLPIRPHPSDMINLSSSLSSGLSNTDHLRRQLLLQQQHQEELAAIQRLQFPLAHNNGVLLPSYNPSLAVRQELHQLELVRRLHEHRLSEELLLQRQVALARTRLQPTHSHAASMLPESYKLPPPLAAPLSRPLDRSRRHSLGSSASVDAISTSVCGGDQESMDDQGDTKVAGKVRAKSKKKDTKWLNTLEELKAYKAEHGDCVVPRGYSENPKLASWVAEQRKQYKLLSDGKQSSITPERVALLNELEFSWNAQEAAWARHMADLEGFRQENGHCHVPLNHTKFPKLGLWVKEQRRHYTLMKQGKQSHMTFKRAEELNNIGFCWDTHEATWLERLRELTLYAEKHGDCIVPTNYLENPKLSTWVAHQRRQYRKFREGKPCHITQERIDALEKLGFVWKPRGGRLASSSESESDDYSTSSFDDSERPTKRLKV